VRDHTDGDLIEGRLLVESGELVAGSMARSAATLVFEPAAARVRLAPDLAACLSRAATAAAGFGDLPASSRVRSRAGGALAFAAELGVTRASQGRTARTDGFLAPDGGERVAGDEVAEAVVRCAAESVEEWRVRHYGYLLAEAAVSPDLDADLVQRGLRTAIDLTGRQWLFLAAVGRRERVPLPMAPLPDDSRAWTAWGALEDVSDLQRRGLLDPPVAVPRPGGAPLPRLRMADLRLTRRGVLVHRLLALDFVREDQVVAALAALGLPRT
jgi:hypothetical protein